MSWLARIIGRLPRSWLKAVGRTQWRHPWLKCVFDWAANRLRGRDAIIQQGAGRGLRINAGGSNAGYVLGTSEPHVQRALTLLLTPGMTVYDVGANVGFFAVIAGRLVGAAGHVLCFEPLEANARLIEHNAALNRFTHVTVRREALGREDGTAQFLLSSVPSWGKLATAGTVSQQTGEITVPVRCLDSIATERPGPPPKVIKLDAEGAEADVLAGGESFLATARPVLLVELHGTNEPVAHALEALGYRSVILGSRGDIRSAPWNAHVVAFPPALERVADLAQQLTDPEILS